MASIVDLVYLHKASKHMPRTKDTYLYISLLDKQVTVTSRTCSEYTGTWEKLSWTVAVGMVCGGHRATEVDTLWDLHDTVQIGSWYPYL